MPKDDGAFGAYLSEGMSVRSGDWGYTRNPEPKTYKDRWMELRTPEIDPKLRDKKISPGAMRLQYAGGLAPKPRRVSPYKADWDAIRDPFGFAGEEAEERAKLNPAFAKIKKHMASKQMTAEERERDPTRPNFAQQCVRRRSSLAPFSPSDPSWRACSHPASAPPAEPTCVCVRVAPGTNQAAGKTRTSSTG